MTDLKKIFCCSFILLSSSLLHAQDTKNQNVIITGLPFPAVDSSKKILIADLIVTGTKKTKPYIVYREIQFKKGDSLMISELNKQLEQARQQVYNTSLFHEVKFEAVATGTNGIIITVTVKERWYWYPVPQFQWVDRNFNEWYKTYNARFDRVNYGLKFVHYNLSGRKDQLRIYLINGYSRNISFSYTAPYSNKALTEGFTVGAGFTQKREAAYKTSYKDSLLFYPSDSATKAKADFVYKNWYAHASYIIRRGLFKKHILSVSYNYIKLADSVISESNNPNYFGEPVSSRGYVDLSYVFQYSKLNNNSYPLQGTSGFIGVIKRGFGFTGGINMLNIEGSLNKYYDLGKNWYSSIQLNGKIKLPFEQAYINQRGLGYGESYLRGLEYYVIDGVATALVKTTLKKKILSFSVPFPFFPKLFTKIPFSFFAKTYADVGYAYNKKPYTYLNNRLLYSGGFGIDILTLYDINLRFEYSFNQLKENGLFLHNQSGF
ncbi:MAG TPA: POTRA domain-containing protein [Ferruginibacter sp.]|nr:POTRA domain-containing protein [Ferruginibacter sp.]